MTIFNNICTHIETSWGKRFHCATDLSHVATNPSETKCKQTKHYWNDSPHEWAFVFEDALTSRTFWVHGFKSSISLSHVATNQIKYSCRWPFTQLMCDRKRFCVNNHSQNVACDRKHYRVNSHSQIAGNHRTIIQNNIAGFKSITNIWKRILWITEQSSKQKSM